MTGDEGNVPLEAIPLHSTNLLTLLDEDGVVRYESPAIERIFGYEPHEPVGDRVADYFHPDDREAVVEAFERVVQSDADRVESVEYRHERADGTYCWVESVASADPTPGGYYVVNTQDVSDRRARERELERTNERLEAFASIVSHDLRNPLNVAAGRLQQVREERGSDRLDVVATAHERMEAMVDDLLTLARVGDGVDGLEPVDLADLSETCWQTVATADSTLEVDVDRTVMADRLRLRQLLENLFRNAVEHSSTGPRSPPAHEDAVEPCSTSPRSPGAREDDGGGVTVTVDALEDGGGFYVADDGPGVDEEVRERVFESGYSTRKDGTGYGLAIVSEVAGAHGWEVRLTDGSEGGACFEFTGVEFR